MNDWLDYKGSGSARTYVANGLTSDYNISHGLFGIQTKKDKEVSKAKQDEAEKRYNAAVFLKFQNQCYELRSKVIKLSDDTNKLNRKMEQAHKLKLQRYDYKGNPKAESAIDSARRNLSNEITRLYDKLHKERKSLASEYNQLQEKRNEYEKNGIKIPEQTTRYMSEVEVMLSSTEYYIDTQYKFYRDTLTAL